MPDQIPPQMTVEEFNRFLASLDLSNPALAALLRESLGGLLTAVPEAGEYTTSIDYTTLTTALKGEYVSDVIEQYQAILGNAPDLIQAAVAAGHITPEQATALQNTGFTSIGSLEQKYMSQGGLRALAGPYQAERAQILEQALGEIEAAAQKASEDGYKLALEATNSRITALDAAGRGGVNLVGAGVSRRNAQDMAGAGGGEPLEMPVPPRPERPEWWEALLPAVGAAGVAGLMKWLGEKPAKTPEEAAQEKFRIAQEEQRLRTEFDEPAREIVGRIQSPAPTPAPSYASMESRDATYGGPHADRPGVFSPGLNPFAGGSAFEPHQLGMPVSMPQEFQYSSSSNPFNTPTYSAPGSGGSSRYSRDYDYGGSDNGGSGYQNPTPNAYDTGWDWWGGSSGQGSSGGGIYGGDYYDDPYQGSYPEPSYPEPYYPDYSSSYGGYY